MSNLHIDAGIRYVTDQAGEKTDVLVPLEVWKKILDSLQTESGLVPVDEKEPVGQILANFQVAMQAAKARETSPVSELWRDIDCD